MIPMQDSEEESQQWVTSVNRGGLVHVTIDTFMLFHSMEMELRQHFSKQRAVEMENGFSEQVKYRRCIGCTLLHGKSHRRVGW